MGKDLVIFPTVMKTICHLGAEGDSFRAADGNAKVTLKKTRPIWCAWFFVFAWLISGFPSDAVAESVEPAFQSALVDDESLYSSGGVAVKEIAGKRFLLGVGTTAARPDKSPSEAVRRTLVGQVNAKAEIARMLNSSVSVEKVLTAYETPADAEELRSLITEHSQQILAGVRPVGHWLSEDGTVHFEAVAVELGNFKNGE